jgi:F-type H+-transporting ATPase subunit b
VLDLLAHAAVEAEHHTEAAAFGISLLTPGFFVALAMLIVLAIMLRAGVPGLIARALDARIADISKQLDEAARLRAEAEALRDEYAKKSREAASEIVAIKAAAEHQAEEIVEKAKRDSAALVERRKAIAENKIAAAELAAVEEIRAAAANAAAEAARKLIAETHGAAADRKLVDEAISDL